MNGGEGVAPVMASTAGEESVAAVEQPLRKLLRRARLRARQVLAVTWLVRLAGPVLVGLVLAVLLLKLVGFWFDPLAPPLLLGVLLVGCMLTAALRPLTDRLLLGSLDRRLGLRDRLTTAGWLVQRQSPLSALERAALQDGLAQAQAVHPAEAYGFPPAQRWRATALGLTTLAAAVLAPIPPLLLSPQQRQERAELRVEATPLKPLAKALERSGRQGQDLEAQRLARQLKRLHQDMLRGRLDRKQALLQMEDLRRELQRLQHPSEAPRHSPQRAEKLNREAAAQLARDASRAAREARKQGKPELARQLQEKAQQARRQPQTAALQQEQRELQAAATELGLSLPDSPELKLDLAALLQQPDSQQAAQQLRQLQEKLAARMEKLSPQEREKLARQMEQAAKTLQKAGASRSAAQLCRSAQALRAGNCKNAQQALLGKGNSSARQAAVAAAARAAERGMQSALCAGQGSCAALGSRSGGASANAGCGTGAGAGAPQAAIPKNAPGASLYAPRRTNVKATPTPVAAAIGNPQGGMIAGQVRGAPDKLTASHVPYYEVVGGYSRAAEEALQREEVPPAYRTTVRDYFEALQSGKPAAAGSGPTPQETAP